MSRRWLITGGGGMLSTDLCDELDGREEDFVVLTQFDLDITDAAAVMTAVREVKPDIIVNCAAYTAVDAAEKDEAVATAVNGSALEFLAGAANDVDAVLAHISTDFVFDGSKRTPGGAGRTTVNAGCIR